MDPQREILWNIPYGELVYILGAIAVGALIYAFYRRYKYWHLGGLDKRPRDIGKRIWAFIYAILIDGVLHRRFFRVLDGLERKSISSDDIKPKEFYPGLIHFLIFVGTIILLIGTVLDVISHYIVHFLHGDVYLAFSLATDVGGIMAVIGVVLALVRRYIQKPDRLDNQFDDLVALLLILVVVITGFFVEGLRIAATELRITPDWAPWSPGGYVVALMFKGLSQGALITLHQVSWWLHSVISVGAIIYVALYFSRLWHIVIDPLNVYFRNLGPRGALVPINLEEAETFGASKIVDFSWKHLMDLDACTRCGRCQDNCPAYLSGKTLNPKAVIQDIKGHWEEEAPLLLKDNAVNPQRDLITTVVGEERIWDCTTCRACQQACPVYVEHIDKIVDMRRNLVLEESRFPETLQDAMKSLGTRGHPWRGTTLARSDWYQGLDVKTMAECNGEVDILYWVGCTAALDERNTKIAVAMAKILNAAGVNFAILGEEEGCCGDPARRTGDEYLFQTLCEANLEVFKAYNVKKILTACPHGYNVFKNEYPQFGGDFDVVHHSQFIADLIRQGRLEVGKVQSSLTIAYHDSCYLGRYNDIYDDPRDILNMIGAKKVELSRCRDRGFCCGGGGGHMWLEEPPDKRLNVKRTEEVIDARADIVATACPYCLIMFEDAIKAKEMEESIKSRDISELIVESAGLE